MEEEKRSGASGVTMALVINAIVIGLTLPFLLVPRQASVRAGGWGLIVFGLAGASLWIGGSRCLSDLRSGRRLRAVIGIVLSLLPLPLAIFLFHWCAQIKGFELAP